MKRNIKPGMIHIATIDNEIKREKARLDKFEINKWVEYIFAEGKK